MTRRIWKGWGEEWEYRGQRTFIQQKRYEALLKDGLKPYQARHFVFYKFSNAYMRRFRTAIRKGLAGRSQRSAWDLWRRIYDDAVRKGRRGDRGGYIPPSRSYDPNKPHKKLIATGEIDYSHTKEYERKRRSVAKSSPSKPRPSGDVNVWIRQLEQSIEATDDPNRKAQLGQQIERLRNRIR